ncbi:hypothetical protein [Serratia sp. 2723]|uniref:hypothetical protein n=1 Tax=unclassified Serratia (in: enterobacteria) TaxID=2647522 RepID=UPI003D1D9749
MVIAEKIMVKCNDITSHKLQNLKPINCEQCNGTSPSQAIEPILLGEQQNDRTAKISKLGKKALFSEKFAHQGWKRSKIEA